MIVAILIDGRGIAPVGNRKILPIGNSEHNAATVVGENVGE
jgi:hypothetical protein